MTTSERILADGTDRDRDDLLVPALTELSGWLVDDGDLEQAMRRVAELAVRLVPHCDLASVTLLRGVGAQTVGATEPAAEEIDAVQYLADDGPCLRAARENRTMLAEDDEAWAQWPELTAVAHRYGVNSFLAAPFVVRNEALGALNLFSRSESAFGTVDAVLLDAYRHHAAVALANARAYERALTLADQLRDAMDHRSVIEQAKGVLIAQLDVDAVEAFDRLRSRSQERNTKLREIAEQVVALRRW